MRISAISVYENKSSLRQSSSSVCKRPCVRYANLKYSADTVSFGSKGGKILGGLLGGAAGGAAGGAIIAGGSLAALGSVIALGPLGAVLAIAYTVGGAAAGGYVGSGIGDAITDKNKTENKDDIKKP